jgi:hypothetical protein
VGIKAKAPKADTSRNKKKKPTAAKKPPHVTTKEHVGVFFTKRDRPTDFAAEEVTKAMSSTVKNGLRPEDTPSVQNDIPMTDLTSPLWWPKTLVMLSAMNGRFVR